MVRKAETDSDTEEETEEAVEEDDELIDDSDGDDGVGDEPEDDSIRLSPADHKDFMEFQAQKRAAERLREREQQESKVREAERLLRFKLEQEKQEAVLKKHTEWANRIKSEAQTYMYVGAKARSDLVAIWETRNVMPEPGSDYDISYWVCKLHDHAYGPSEEELERFDEKALSSMDSSKREIVLIMLEGRREHLAADKASRLRFAEEEKEQAAERAERERISAEKQRRLDNHLCPKCGKPFRQDSFWDGFRHRKCHDFKW